MAHVFRQGLTPGVAILQWGQRGDSKRRPGAMAWESERSRQGELSGSRSAAWRSTASSASRLRSVRVSRTRSGRAATGGSRGRKFGDRWSSVLSVHLYPGQGRPGPTEFPLPLPTIRSRIHVRKLPPLLPRGFPIGPSQYAGVGSTHNLDASLQREPPSWHRAVTPATG